MKALSVVRAIEALNRENPVRTWSWRELALRTGLKVAEVVPVAAALQARGLVESTVQLRATTPPAMVFTRREITACAGGSR